MRLKSNGERHLKSRHRLARLYPASLLAETITFSKPLTFSLNELDYRYPAELVPTGYTATAWLHYLTEQGKRWRWPDGVAARVEQQITQELALIAELGYEAYFLTVYDIVRFARKQGILCQGRGSAANSAVCFCLGITEVDPARINMLMERFISRERNEPPDIDVDFEHERREEVIQYIYTKYGRLRAALTASVTTYKPRSAIRDVGKALGLSGLQTDRMARAMQWWDGANISRDRVIEAGLDPDSPVVHRLLMLVGELLGCPRHLSQHVGGFLVAEQPLTGLVPIENAAMPERTVIQWDKNDLDDLGLLKIDVLALGMLSAIHRCFDLIGDWYGRHLTMATLPAEDPAVYRMLSRADTVGVFQIESRAQMAMLPRLKPASYYDLVIEVALIRPGPIQGDMVHPYLRRRNGEEAVTYPSAAVRGVLERTLGVPIFQEQVMQLAIIAAGFTGGEADQLRRAMAAWKRRGGLEPFHARLIDGMRARGYSSEFAEQIYRQIQGFGEYGFPESHAASFALLVYVSAWLKCHEPAVFTCALLNSQPMGFYAPAQIIQSAQAAGVTVHPVDINQSNWDCSLEGLAGRSPQLRLGLRMVKGLSQAGAQALVAARTAGKFTSIADLSARVALNAGDYGALAAADALRSIVGNRHRSSWEVAGIEPQLPVFNELRFNEGEPLLRVPQVAESVLDDYASTGLSLREHPLALLREQLGKRCVRAAEFAGLADGALIRAAGLVITRQRPASAANVSFVTLEDETGFVNVVVWEQIAERQRQALLNASLLEVYGQLQKQDGVIHLIARSLTDRTYLLGNMRFASRDFH
jgi:error-prone DNA polymerase